MAARKPRKAKVAVEFKFDENDFWIRTQPDRADELRDLLRRITRIAKRRAPKRSGELRRKIKPSAVKAVNKAVARGTVESNAPHSKWVHDGTDPHVIRPRSAQGMLVFHWRGRLRHFKHVNHPGTKPNPFLRTALREGASRELGRARGIRRG